jgi:polysaccharide export outer membrane protein
MLTSLWRVSAAAVLACALGLGPAPGEGAAPEYRIGVDDVLGISVWDNKDLDQVVFVRPDGKISLPLLGEIQAAGLTVADLSARLSELYGRTIKGAQVTVSVREIRSRPVFFLGGISKTTPLQVTQSLTLSQALSLAGGVSPGADLEKAFVLRGDRVIGVDFARLIQKGDVTQNIQIMPGDTIIVPIAEAVFVQGEVRAPGIVKFTKNLTVLRAIAQAGGLTQLAAGNRVSVLRSEGDKKQNLRVNVNDVIKNPESTPDMMLQPNDIVIVPQRLF